jgi:uncharacterized UBP type Zn finger protein
MSEHVKGKVHCNNCGDLVHEYDPQTIATLRAEVQEYRDRAEKAEAQLRAQQPQATCWICRAKVANGVQCEGGCEVGK